MTSGAIIAQSNGKRENLHAVSSHGYGWATSAGVEARIVSIRREPISYEGESVIFDPKLMTTGFPHVFEFMDHYMAVIKSPDGTLNFFYFTDPDDEAAE